MKKTIFFIALWCILSTAYAQTPAKKTTTAAPAKSSVKLGDNYAGGIVFWIDPASTASAPHGLVCTPSDQAEPLKWTTIFQSAQYLGVNGFSDWRIPSKTELARMYAFYKKTGLGSFKAEIYWSATPHDDESAWYMDFGTGNQDFQLGKKSKFLYRAIRSF